MTQQQKRSHTGGALFYIMALIYIGLLILFAWQTGIFVNWLFPNDQIMMKILTVVCFDGMAFLWAMLDLFYRFAAPGTRNLVRWGWGISFLLSLFASVLYLIISSFFRFDIIVDSTWVDVGYGVVITAIVFQIVMTTFFLYCEWLIRHPHQDEWYSLPALPEQTSRRSFTEEEKRRIQEWINEPVALAQVSSVKKKRSRKSPITEQLEGEQVENIMQQP